MAGQRGKSCRPRRKVLPASNSTGRRELSISLTPTTSTSAATTVRPGLAPHWAWRSIARESTFGLWPNLTERTICIWRRTAGHCGGCKQIPSCLPFRKPVPSANLIILRAAQFRIQIASGKNVLGNGIKHAMSALALVGTAAIMMACGANPQTKEPSGNTKVDNGKGSAANQPSAAFDPCILLTKEDAEAALGASVKRVTPQGLSPADTCQYLRETGDNLEQRGESVTLQVHY